MSDDWHNGEILRNHHLTASRELSYQLSDEEWTDIKSGKVITITFHPMWMPSGWLVAFVGDNPTPEDPRAQEIMSQGGNCCRYPTTEAVKINLEAKGATTATYGPFNLTLLLERTAKELQEVGKSSQRGRE